MKRRGIVFEVCFCLLFALAACQQVPPTSPQAVGNQQLTPSNEANQQNCLGSAETALVDLQCREVTIAVENAYLPFNYIELKTNQPGGWDYDTWRQICTLLHCTPVFKEAGWDGLIQSVGDGLYNVGADGLTITEERKKIVDFSNGYLQITQRLLVRAGEARFENLEGLAKLKNLTVGTQSGTSNYETAVKYLPAERIKAFEQMPFAIQALLSKDVDAVVIDEVAGLGYQGQDKDKLIFVGPGMSSDQLAFLFPKGSDLMEPVNKAIAAMKENGALNEINLKFFGPEFKLTDGDIKK
ncbi:MAG: transporter substrate-binding domain-containing protein [Anaerolineaceae bacterium]|nr:transporter substrate-binding domain-containing protein [Anaerolineaceae bacterium]